MPRRASSRVHPGLIVGVIAAVAAAVFAGRTILGNSKKPFSNVAPLAMEEVLQNANSLRGNEYLIQGQIDEKLQWTTDRGQLVSVRVESPSGDEFIGIEIPPKFDRLNIGVKQSYAFRVKFRDGGIAVATDIERL